MRRPAQHTALLAIGGTLLWITIANREYLNYVRPSFQPYLIVAGALLSVLGLTGIITAWRDEHSGDHHGAKAAWLLLLPPLVIFALAPSAMGSFTAARAVNQTPPPEHHNLAALPTGGPAPISLTDFTARAFQAHAGHDTLTGRQVLLTGFAHPAGPNRWLLIRLRMTCCAADAVPMRIAIINLPPPPADAWVRITGTWSPTWAKIQGIDTPQLTATALQPIPKPADPYE